MPKKALTSIDSTTPNISFQQIEEALLPYEIPELNKKNKINDSIQKSIQADHLDAEQTIPVLKSPGNTSYQENSKFDASYDISDTLIFILLAISNDQKERLRIGSNFLKEEQSFSALMNKRELETLQKAYPLEKARTLVSKAEKLLPALTLMGGGALSFASAGAVSLSAVGLGTLFLLDTLLDDKYKKILASWIGRGKEESETVWLGRMHLFCSLAAFGLGLGLNGSKILQIGLQAANIATTAGQGLVTYTSGVHKANMIEINELLENSYKNIDYIAEEMRKVTDFIRDQIKLMRQIENQKTRLCSMFFR